jgi:hypothetical protein
MNPQFSDDGRWWWDGYRWVPAPRPPAAQPRPRRNNALLVFAVIAATSILWGPVLYFLIVFAGTNFMAGFNGH